MSMGHFETRAVASPVRALLPGFRERSDHNSDSTGFWDYVHPDVYRQNLLLRHAHGAYGSDDSGDGSSEDGSRSALSSSPERSLVDPSDMRLPAPAEDLVEVLGELSGRLPPGCILGVDDRGIPGAVAPADPSQYVWCPGYGEVPPHWVPRDAYGAAADALSVAVGTGQSLAASVEPPGVGTVDDLDLDPLGSSSPSLPGAPDVSSLSEDPCCKRPRSGACP